MNTRRVRAGGPPPCTSSGCNYPEGECLGICHRVNTHCMTKKVATVMPELPIQFAEPEPKPGVITKFRSFYRNLERRLSKVMS